MNGMDIHFYQPNVCFLRINETLLGIVSAVTLLIRTLFGLASLPFFPFKKRKEWVRSQKIITAICLRFHASIKVYFANRVQSFGS